MGPQEPTTPQDAGVPVVNPEPSAMPPVQDPAASVAPEVTAEPVVTSEVANAEVGAAAVDASGVSAPDQPVAPVDPGTEVPPQAPQQ